MALASRVLKDRMDSRLFGLAAMIRFVFLRFTGLPASVENRVELANTQVGIKSVREAVYLLGHSVPIYQNKSTCQPVQSNFWRPCLIMVVTIDCELCGVFPMAWHR